jgi:lysophospholipase L1-like esterase
MTLRTFASLTTFALLTGVSFAQQPPTAAPTPTAAPAPKLEPAVPFTVRDGLPNAAAKLQAAQSLNVVFLGGSITVEGASPNGYVTFVDNWLKTNYPNAKINVFDAGISGTGSDYGARRFDRDVLSKNPDLVFIEFCVNDGDADRTTEMERMVHKAWLKNPNMDLVIFYTLEKHHLPYYQAGNLPPSASAHERVAAFYGIPSISPALNVATKVNAGTLPWESFSHDGCHPTQDGFVLFDDVFAQALPELLKASPAKAHDVSKSITANLQVYPPEHIAKPVTFTTEIATASGEKPSKIYALPIPGTNWVKDSDYLNTDGKTLWKLSWMPKTLGGKLDPTVGADKTAWANNAMTWLEEGASFDGPEGESLFSPRFENADLGISRKEIGVLRFVAPETGR